MKKLIAIAAVAFCASVFAKQNTVVTNALDVYDVKVTVKAPVVKYDKKAGVYKTYETRKLQGYFYVNWVTEYGNETVSYGIPDVELYEVSGKTKTYVPFEIVRRSDLSIYGKKLTGTTATFTAVNKEASATKAGCCELSFAGIGSTKDYKVVQQACGPCGITSPVKTNCRKAYSFSGNVVGAWSCGCGSESPSYLAAECGLDEDAPTPINGCYGSWSAKYNKNLSETYSDPE